MGAASQAVPVLRHRAEDTQTDAADEACGDNVSVAEAGCSEVDIDACREDEMGCPGGWRGEEGCE